MYILLGLEMLKVKITLGTLWAMTDTDDLNTVIQNAKSHSEIRFDVVWLLYNIFA